MTFRIKGSKRGIGRFSITEADAGIALRVAVEWIDDGWTDVTLTDEERGHVLDARRIAGAFAAHRRQHADR